VPTILSSWFAAVLVAPVCEEIFFRGTLQAWLHRTQTHKSGDDSLREIIGGWDRDTDRHQNLGEIPGNGDPKRLADPATLLTFLSWLPIVTSALVFAAVHWGQGLAPIPLFVFGVALGYVYRQTRSVIPCIVMHMLLNGYSMLWATIPLVVDNS